MARLRKGNMIHPAGEFPNSIEIIGARVIRVRKNYVDLQLSGREMRTHLHRKYVCRSVIGHVGYPRTFCGYRGPPIW